MDHQDWKITINRWFDLRRRAVAQFICAVVYYYVRMSRKRKISYSMSSERERVREERMGRISSSEASRNILRMQSQEPSPTTSTGSKWKKSKVASYKGKDSEANEITGAMHAVAEALREGNTIMKEQQNYKLPPISGEETWNLIKECGFDTNSLATIFCSLIKDVDKLRPILQLPAEARKAVIMKMVFGSSDPPS